MTRRQVIGERVVGTCALVFAAVCITGEAVVGLARRVRR